MEAYKQRMINEYNELKERQMKLGDMLLAYSKNELDFEPTCPITLLETQWCTMTTYRNILKLRAEIEGIEL
ncbi:hypothetical protein SAMN05216392_0358 [Streptococcus equinus]|uniref:Phage protein n=1 Tax=Streptococcus equinus TaxID=1335 RepID=A0A1H0Y1C8_STREI|nr:hypothetical protein [Streptococcus equinus]QBX24856.1 hypothetical protein Javan214_0019 [Streptococcus phage Javan214]SDQ08962.1 hypothetical protein SAMN05216392_0358 [Streptococcus equinus]